jgi:hypothetical protein
VILTHAVILEKDVLAFEAISLEVFKSGEATTCEMISRRRVSLV